MSAARVRTRARVPLGPELDLGGHDVRFRPHPARDRDERRRSARLSNTLGEAHDRTDRRR